MAIKWTEDLSTGIETIDEQHKELFKRVNDLMEACTKGKGKQEVEKVIGFLGDYVVMHFGEEEKIMKAESYPGYDGHKNQHEIFIKKFEEFKGKLEQTGPTVDLVVKMNGFLVDWLINHIKKTDRALGDYLKK
ncbi:hemerythrin [Caldanaerovirga acetigignens]|uniref:Hemerythrin n=1 Tax=Caldanaerovirga acetigignens TaxID=447595 RepID=A0A1M7IMW7_9FIRM|nr:bacteriohemerythrin [Caldanaerovirga acetigignens]SHM42156.1 hemerythrin [Caldanaerovirga acetigignens]